MSAESSCCDTEVVFDRTAFYVLVTESCHTAVGVQSPSGGLRVLVNRDSFINKVFCWSLILMEDGTIILYGQKNYPVCWPLSKAPLAHDSACVMGTTRRDSTRQENSELFLRYNAKHSP